MFSFTTPFSCQIFLPEYNKCYQHLHLSQSNTLYLLRKRSNGILLQIFFHVYEYLLLCMHTTYLAIKLPTQIKSLFFQEYIKCIFYKLFSLKVRSMLSLKKKQKINKKTQHSKSTVIQEKKNQEIENVKSIFK